jgi:hypothetical protein
MQAQEGFISANGETRVPCSWWKTWKLEKVNSTKFQKGKYKFFNQLREEAG